MFTDKIEQDLTSAIEEKLAAICDINVDTLAETIAQRLTSSFAADIVARLRIDVLAGDDVVLSRTEAAQLLGRSIKTLELWSSKGVGPAPCKMGVRAVGYRLGELRRFVAERQGAVLPGHAISKGTTSRN